MTEKTKISVLLLGLSLVGLSAALTMSWMSSATKAQNIIESNNETDDSESEIDQTIATCVAFVNAESHLDNVWIARQTSDAYKLQREETAIYDFLNWYQNGGRLELLTAGDFCSLDTVRKSGKAKGLEARVFVTDVERQNADFFAREMKRCEQ